MTSSTAWQESLRSLPALVELVSVPYVRRRSGRLIAVLLAIALGVSAIVASGNLIHSALNSIETGWRVSIGQVDIRVSNGFAGIPQLLTEEIAGVDGVSGVSALVSENTSLNLDGERRNLQIVAIDLLGDDPDQRRALGVEAAEIPDETLLLTRLNAVLLDRAFAAANGLSIGSSMFVELRSGRQELQVAGLIEPNPVTAAFGGAVAVMDLPAAQILLGREEMIDSIGVRIDDDADLAAVADEVREMVAETATVARTNEPSPELASLIANLRLILGVPGMIALVIGALLIHHAVFIAVSERKPQIDVIRSLGTSRRSLLALFAFEGCVVGVLGSAIGVALGTVATPLAAGVVRETMSALYRPLAIAQFEPAYSSIAAATLLGVSITVHAFVSPARASVRPISSLAVASPERERWEAALKRAWVGAAAIATGVLAGSVQRSGIEGETLATVATTSDAMILFGVGLLLPVALLMLARAGRSKPRSGRWPALRLAWLNLIGEPARSAIVLTSVVIGSAYVMITVGPIGSLRNTIVSWIERTQSADLVVAAAGSTGFFPNSALLPGGLYEDLRRVPGVMGAEATGLVTQPYGERWMVLIARRPESLGQRYPMLGVVGSLERARAAMKRGDGGVVSRHFANQHRHAVGDVLSLRSPTGEVSYRIEAIAQDYSSADLGSVFVSPEMLESRWKQTGANTIHLWVDEATRLDPASVLQLVWEYCGCAVLTAQELETHVAGVVDAAFYMAYALEVVAVVVVVLSVLSFFAIALDERREQTANLRAVGASGSQLARSLLCEAALIGLVGGSLGSGTGVWLGRRMALTTMRAGGGFELDFVLPIETVGLTVLGAIVVCTIAAAIQLASGKLRSSAAKGV